MAAGTGWLGGSRDGSQLLQTEVSGWVQMLPGCSIIEVSGIVDLLLQDAILVTFHPVTQIRVENSCTQLYHCMR